MTKPSDIYPAIVKAAIAMAVANDALTEFRTEADLVADLNSQIGKFCHFDLSAQKIDRWLASLNDEEIELVISGDRGEATVFIATHDAPVRLRPFLEFVYEQVL